MAKKNTRISTIHSNILMTLNDDREPIGYFLNIRRKNLKFNMSFNFERFGGRDRALIKALEIRHLAYTDPEKLLEIDDGKEKDYTKIADRIYSVNNIYYTVVVIWDDKGKVQKKISVSKDAYTKEQAIKYLSEERLKYATRARAFKKNKSLTDHKFIYKTFNTHDLPCGFRFQYSRKGIKFDRTFNYFKCGGEQKALKEAIKYRDECLKDLV